MQNVEVFPLVYSGSVKNLRCVEAPEGAHPGVYLFEYTDDYSIFDYGKMPDAVAGKGAAMAVMSAYIFEQLESPKRWKALARSDVWCRIKMDDFREALLASETMKTLVKRGLPTHYRGMRDREGALVRTDRLREPSNCMEVAAVPIVRPECGTVGESTLWNYNAIHPGLESFLIPLEWIFRFGVPPGSSLLERIALDPKYHRTLGLRRRPREGSWLARPILELSSKLETGDRYLPLEGALNFSGLSMGEFGTIVDWTTLIAVFLYDLFSDVGLRLWDGKFEYTRTGAGPMLADAITPDELRLTKGTVQISKEPLRQYYRKYDSKFVGAMKQAKVLAHRTRREIRDVMDEDLGVEPARLAEPFRQAIEAMYTGLTHELTGLTFFESTGSLRSAIRGIRKYV